MKYTQNLLVATWFIISSLMLPVAAQAVAATDLACAGCVGTTDIANVAVTGPKLGNNAVTTGKISDGTIANVDIGLTAAIDPTKIYGSAWTAVNDGSLTGLDADYIDGLNSSQFLRNDADGSLVGSLSVSGGGISTQDSTRTFAGTTFNSAIGSSDTRTLALNGSTYSSVWWNGGGTPQFAIDSLGGGGAGLWTYNGSWSERIRIEPTNGNVGIGTTAPGKKLEVVGDVVSRSGSDIAMAGSMAADGYGLNFWTNPGYDSASPDSSWTRGMTINGDNVGIGTTTPATTLNVAGDIRTDSGYIRANRNHASYAALQAFQYGAGDIVNFGVNTGSDETLFLVDHDGKVGIGTSSPSASLDVRGDLYVSGAVQLGATMVFPSPDIADHGNPDTVGSIAWYVVRLADIGGVIYLQPGTYYVDSQAIPLADNLAIIGSGPGSKIVATANLTDDLINNESEALGEPGVRNVTLKDFVLTGNHYTDWYSGLGGPGDYQDCIDIGGITTEADYNTNISLSGLIVSDCGEMGIIVKHTDELTMSDIFLYDNGTSEDYHHNIYLSEMNNAMLNNIQTIGAAGNGIKISHVNKATLTNIIARNNDRYGIRVDADSNQVSIASSSAYDNGASGFYFMTDGGGAYDATLSGCTAYGNTDHGLKIDHSDNISVTGCIIRDNDIDGIHLEGADNITMTGNSVRDNNDDGLDLDASSGNTIFVGNINVGNGDDDVSGTVTVKDLNI